MSDLTIRPAKPGDEVDILRIIRALAEYEGEADAVENTVEALTAHLFGDHPKVFAHIALLSGEVVGAAIWYLSYSTWTGRHGIYLEDIFVEPAARGVGVARELFEALAAEALDHGYPRIDWEVLDWNELAKGFYRRLGAVHNDTWENWRLSGPALAALRSGPDGGADRANP
jgi:GNAT superfamily N-acetyltransferase